MCSISYIGAKINITNKRAAEIALPLNLIQLRTLIRVNAFGVVI